MPQQGANTPTQPERCGPARWERRLFLFFLLIAIALRIVSWSGRTAIQTDSEQYISSGVNLFRGNGLVDTSGAVLTSKPPLYPTCIGLCWLVLGDGEQAARMVSFLSGLGVVLLLHRFASLLWGRTAALVTMGLAAVYPSLVNISTAALAESLTMCLELAALFFLARSLAEWKTRDALLCALFLALAGWTRSTAVLRGGAVLLVLLCFVFPRGAGTRRKAFGSAIVFAVVFSAVLVPLMFLNYTHTGRWSLNPEASTWLQIELAREDDTTYEDALADAGSRSREGPSVLQAFSESPSRLLRHYFENAYTFYKQTLPTEISPLFLVLAGIGLVTASQGSARMLAALVPLFLPIVAWVLMRGTEPRDVVPLVPAVLLLAAPGILRLWDWGRGLDSKDGGWIRGRLVSGSLIFLAVAFCLPGAVKYRLGSQGQAVEHKLMGLWIKESIPQEDRRIISRKPMVVFYAEGQALPVVRGDLEDLRDWAKSRQARYLCVDSRHTAPAYPVLAPLLDPQAAPGWLEFVQKTTAPDGETLLLYEIEEE